MPSGEYQIPQSGNLATEVACTRVELKNAMKAIDELRKEIEEDRKTNAHRDRVATETNLLVKQLTDRLADLPDTVLHHGHRLNALEKRSDLSTERIRLLAREEASTLFSASSSGGIVATVLRQPWLPVLVVLLLMLIAALAISAVLTGRDVSELTPPLKEVAP